MYVQETPVPVLGARSSRARISGGPVSRHDSVSVLVGAGQTILTAHGGAGTPSTVYDSHSFATPVQVFVYGPTWELVRNPAARTASTVRLFRLTQLANGSMGGQRVQLPVGTLVALVG